MKRNPLSLTTVADWHNLMAAFYLAARGKSGRPDVEDFRRILFAQINQLQNDVLSGAYVPGPMRQFRIRDPKPRIIHAPCFRDRVLHHALMAHVGPVLDRALVFDTYACRLQKGTLAAVLRAQRHIRRYPWYAKIDIRAYFASIDHKILMALLAQRFRDHGLLSLMARIIAAHQNASGTGLPIGALTSQIFANYYLSSLDRLLLEQYRVSGMVRYMDDVVWWGQSREQVRTALDAARTHTHSALHLGIKSPVQVGRSEQGVLFCGYRILPGALRLSRRRKRRYIEGRRRWETAFLHGAIDEKQLQAGYAAVLGMTLHADAVVWRQKQLQQQPLATELEQV
ncbi:MAG: reverse transcriptase domain-containing protein [Bacteroidales bacterium]